MKAYFFNILIAIDQLAHALIGGKADETLSAAAHRNDWMIQHLISLLAWDRNHCASAYNSEKYGLHLPEEYRK